MYGENAHERELDKFARRRLEQAIEQTVGDSDYKIETYTDLVTERLDVVPSPVNNGLFVPASEVDPTPAIDRKPYKELSSDERVEGLQVVLGREAVKNGGIRQYGVPAIVEHVFDGRPASDTVKGYMADASQSEGYQTNRRNGRLVLQTHVSEIADEELLNYIEAGDGITPGSMDQLTLPAVADGGSEGG